MELKLKINMAASTNSIVEKEIAVTKTSSKLVLHYNRLAKK